MGMELRRWRRLQKQKRGQEREGEKLRRQIELDRLWKPV